MMTRRLLPILATAALGAALAFAACSSPSSSGSHKDAGPGGGDAGPGDASGGGDGGGQDAAAPGCTSDLECPGQICNADAGRCVSAQRCNNPSNCAVQDPGHCPLDPATQDPSCVCEPADAGGICVQRIPNCQSCAVVGGVDLCGYDDPANPNPYWIGDERQCAQLQGSNVCLTLVQGTGCPPGYVKPADGGAYCLPQSGSCAAGPCTRDDDCNLGQVCDLASQLCKPACTFDFDTNVSQGCSTGQVCHVTDRYIQPNTPIGFFGMGHCGAPCDGQADAGAFCATYSSQDSCVAEPPGVSNGGIVEHRCRPAPPACVADKECNNAAPPYKGYCDIATLTCNTTKCRNDNDCVSGYLCTPGTNTCDPAGCVKGGGARVYCSPAPTDYAGDYCCGEPVALPDGGTFTIACPSGVDGGSCYAAPNPPWCATCAKDSDCTATDPHYATDPAICSTAHFQNAIGCLFSCYTPQDCPSNMGCAPIGLATRAADVQCDPTQNGAPCTSAASCQNTGFNTPPDGGPVYACAAGDFVDGGVVPNQYACPNPEPALGEPTHADQLGRWCVIGYYCNTFKCK